MNPITLPQAIERLQRHLIGSDNFFTANSAASPSWFDSPNFPPYSVEKISPESYRLTLALAGFTKDEISISVTGSSLIITGEKKWDGLISRRFIHQGISERDFRREFKLMQNTHVKDAEFKDGLLCINIRYELPEELKPRQIDII